MRGTSVASVASAASVDFFRLSTALLLAICAVSWVGILPVHLTDPSISGNPILMTHTDATGVSVYMMVKPWKIHTDATDATGVPDI